MPAYLTSGTYYGSYKYLYNPDKVLYGTGGDDTLYGSWGNDRLFGFDGDDSLHGGDGADRLYGGWGQDSLYGDSGNDTLYGEEGNDFLNGGAGSDTLYGGSEDDTLWGDNGAQVGSDYLYGQAGNDFLFGGASADYLDGGDGGDRLWGDSGNDTLVGGNGGDLIWGGGGADAIIESGHGGFDYIQLFQGDSLAFTGYADTIVTGSDLRTNPQGIAAVIGLSRDVLGDASRPTGYTSATTIEGAAAEAASQIANYYGDANNDNSPWTHAIYLYNAAQDQGYLAIDMDVDGSYETGIVFTHLSIEQFQNTYMLYLDDLL